MITCIVGGDPRTTRYVRGCLVAVIAAVATGCACGAWVVWAVMAQPALLISIGNVLVFGCVSVCLFVCLLLIVASLEASRLKPSEAKFLIVGIVVTGILVCLVSISK